MNDPRGMKELANENMESLYHNPYPGRGIVLGITEDGLHAVQIYWIMGRSENSRNRVFGVEGGRVFTEPADPTKVKDPSLIIYNAMQEKNWLFVVSNGHQTDAVIEKYFDPLNAYTLSRMLRYWRYEPDAPNFTPRITATFHIRARLCEAEFMILRKSSFPELDTVDSFLFNCQIAHGFGFCFHTYESDGDPLPPFQGKPYPVLVGNSIQETAKIFWGLLNPDNRISLAVKFIDIVSGLSSVVTINRYAKVG